MDFWLLSALTVVVIYAYKYSLAYWNALRSIQNLPGFRVLFDYNHPISRIIPPTAGVTPGGNPFFENKYALFKYFGWDIHSYVSIVPGIRIGLILADASAIKEVTSSRARFPKPVEEYELLSFYGRNIVASEGEEWKKYRKISAPAFSDRNNKLVWDETVKIMNGLFNNVWADQKVVTIDHAVEITLPIALFVIGVAGFGREISWEADNRYPNNHKMPFKEALHVVASDIYLKLIVPNWALGLTKRLRTVATAFDELKQYMSEMIHERQQSDKVERHDLLSKLLEANNEDSEDARLTESELIGNIFIFLIAGHETTAHTLCFAFALLALYQYEQDILLQQIKSVLKDGRQPVCLASRVRVCVGILIDLKTYEEMPLFTRSMAVFYETLRLFPPATVIPKVSAEDTVLTTENMSGEKRTIPVPKGTKLSFSVPGLHHNPRYWKDPEEFKPSRFLEDWPRDAFLPFSGGPRGCLGRKFFETEGIAVLTMLVSKYKITIKEEPQFANETFEERRARVLRTRNGITLTPIKVPLVFTRRD